MATSTWLVALAFVEPRINVSLTPFSFDPKVWAGLLAIATLVLAIAQMRVDWKGRSDAHRRALEAYAEVKREAGYSLSLPSLSDEEYRRVCGRNDFASGIAIAVPERDFLRLKRRHLLKVAISRRLDDYPGTLLWLFVLKVWWRDNLGRR